MKVGQLCSRRPVTASASVPLSEVVRLMCENRVGTVILTRSPADEPVAAGIITDRDVVRAQVKHTADLGSINALDAMTPDPLIVCEDDPIEDALRRLRERGVRRAPVVDKSGTLVGIISVDDVVVQLANEVMALGRLLARQSH